MRVERSLRRALVLLGALGLVAGAVPLALGLANEAGHQRQLITVFAPLTGWAFVGAGIFAWARRPDSRFGPLMTALGFSACLAALRVSTDPWIFITGLLFITSQWALLYHMLLADPTGALSGRFDRLLVGAMYFNSLVMHPIHLLFQDTTRIGHPENPLLVEANGDLSSTLARSRAWFALVLIAALVVIILRRLAAAPRSELRTWAPVVLTAGTVMMLLAIWYAVVLADSDAGLAEGLEEARYVVFAAVPFAFLAGVLQRRMAGASAVSEIVARLGDPSLRHRMCSVLADALEPTSLEFAYVQPDGTYGDVSGRPVKVSPARVVTPIEQGGEPVAAIIHDPTSEDRQELVQAVAAAAEMALENERLGAELQAKIDELSASRARIVESGDAARRRLERDLHDGAQQRLVSVALSLRIVRSKLETDQDPLPELEAARAELDQALDELRELARGIHPSVLSDRGLDAALEGLAHRAPLPVELAQATNGRLPERVESAAYFVVAEALTNVATYARATHAKVDVSRVDGKVRVEIADDGIGGANPAEGSGLRGLVDRVSALGGQLEVDSPSGRGTTVRAVIPCE